MRIEFNVAGLTFRNNDKLSGIKPSGLVELVPEPENKYDTNAIKVMCDGIHIGYVPSDKTQEKKKLPLVQSEIHRLMECEDRFQVEVVSYRYRDGEDWNDDHRGSLGCVTLALCTEGDGDLRENNGKVYGRISQFVNTFEPDGREFLDRWMINGFKTYDDYLRYMAEAADKGTAMHAALEAYFQSGGKEVDLDHLPEKLGEFTSRYRIEPVAFEERLFDDETELSGQFDMLCRVDGVLTVVDWKSSRAVRGHQKLQAAFYSAVKGRELGEPIAGMVVAWGGKPDVATLSPQQCQWGYSVIQLLKRAEKGWRLL